jgi:hypothetical protein
MNKQQKKSRKQGTGVALAYVATSKATVRPPRVDAGNDVIAGAVAGSTSDFSATGYSVNPGLETRFASLSQEAKRYDMYEFEELSFHFVGTTVIATTVGQVGLAFDPNPNATVPNSQARFSAYECHISSSVYKPDGLTLRVPKSMLGGRRYVRSGVEGSNLALYDPGLLVVMVRNEASTDTIGYVEARYKVRFYDFHLEANSQPRRRNVAQLGVSAPVTIVTATPTALDWDTLISGSLHADFDSVPGTVTLSAGYYLIQAVIGLTDSANEAFLMRCQLVAAGDGWSGVNLFDGTVGTYTGPANKQLVVTAICAYNEEVTLTFLITLTGAAGVLRVLESSTCTFLAL